jgi:hypothetical protein
MACAMESLILLLVARRASQQRNGRPAAVLRSTYLLQRLALTIAKNVSVMPAAG